MMVGTRCARAIAGRKPDSGEAGNSWLRLTSFLVGFVAFTSILLFTHSAYATEVLVRVDRVTSGFSLSGQNLRFPGAGPRPYSSVRVKFERLPSGRFRWTVRDRDSEKDLVSFHSLAFEVSGQGLRLNLKAVPSRLLIKPVSDSSLNVIARMDLEEYLLGVLPSEMPAEWPLEALKAQAVAARTYALNRRREKELAGAEYHLESDVMDQVFRDPMQSLLADETKRKVQSAVQATQGLTLMDQQSRPVAAYFHSHCGGKTEEPSAVWGGGPRAGTAVDRLCPKLSSGRWSFQVNRVDLEKRFRRLLGVSSQAFLVSIENFGQTESGRVRDVKLVWSTGEISLLPSHRFRMAIGHERLKSTNFRVSHSSEGRFEFSGLGMGHGAGMCQWGARQLAVQGKTYFEILRHYYPLASLGSSPNETGSTKTASLQPFEARPIKPSKL